MDTKTPQIMACHGIGGGARSSFGGFRVCAESDVSLQPMRGNVQMLPLLKRQGNQGNVDPLRNGDPRRALRQVDSSLHDCNAPLVVCLPSLPARFSHDSNIYSQNVTEAADRRGYSCHDEHMTRCRARCGARAFHLRDESRRSQPTWRGTCPGFSVCLFPYGGTSR